LNAALAAAFDGIAVLGAELGVWLLMWSKNEGFLETDGP